MRASIWCSSSQLKRGLAFGTAASLVDLELPRIASQVDTRAEWRIGAFVPLRGDIGAIASESSGLEPPPMCMGADEPRTLLAGSAAIGAPGSDRS